MTDQPRPVPDDEPLDTVQQRIEDAKASADALHDTDALGDVGEEYGSGRSRADERHGAFEPSGDDRQAGENPSEGADADAPGDLADERREQSADD